MAKYSSKIYSVIRAIAPLIPLRGLIEFSGHKLIMPFYHAVADHDMPHVKHLYRVKSSKEFEKDLDILLKYYKPMAISELIRRNKKEVMEVRKPRCLLTFDDGMREVKDVIIPILKRKGIPATFFLTINFIDNMKLFFRHKASLIIEHITTHFLTKAEKDKVAELLELTEYDLGTVKSKILGLRTFDALVLDDIAVAINIDFEKFLDEYEPYLYESDVFDLIRDGYDIGAHSMDHPYFSDMHFVDQHHQVVMSIEEIRGMFGDSRKVFAFPFSDEGISEEFIDFIFDTGIIEHSFGTSGLKNESFPRHHQRIPMEVGSFNAKQILKQEYISYYLKIPFGGSNIKRPNNF